MGENGANSVIVILPNGLNLSTSCEEYGLFPCYLTYVRMRVYGLPHSPEILVG